MGQQSLVRPGAVLYMNRLKEAMTLLIANDGPLPAEWLDHPLMGDWDGHRECHIGGDFLLIKKTNLTRLRSRRRPVRRCAHDRL